MAWVKIPKENHAVFYARLPRDKRIQTLQMFGAAAAKVNGHLFGGLFARSFMVKLGEQDYTDALALDGAEKFDPMGNGRVMSNSVLMPESLMDDPDEMTAWLQKALDYNLSLPAKAAKPATAKPATTKPATAKSATAKSATAKSATTKPANATKPMKATPVKTKPAKTKPATAKPATAKPAKATATKKPATAKPAKATATKKPPKRKKR
ncbi:MAG: TfoX/Sxy family protein [Kofleriaceae bacterium]